MDARLVSATRADKPTNEEMRYQQMTEGTREQKEAEVVAGSGRW